MRPVRIAIFIMGLLILASMAITGLTKNVNPDRLWPAGTAIAACYCVLGYLYFRAELKQ